MTLLRTTMTRWTEFGRFQFLVTIAVLVLQVAVVGLVDADGRPYDSPSIHTACGSLGNADDELNGKLRSVTENLESAHGAASATANCNRIRGGRLGSTEEAPAVVGENATAEDEASATSKTPPKAIDFSQSPYSFSVFQANDGSEADPDGIPNRFLRMNNHKRDAAKKSLQSTLKWREENHIDTILARPHPTFDVCKKVFPHYFCGRDETGHVILLQRPGLIDTDIAKTNGLSGEDLLWHYIYEMEYLWQILDPAANATMTSVIDLTGLNLSVLRKPELLNIVQLFCSTMDAHFPLRAHKTLLVNAPKWFGAMFKLISPFLRESTKQKMTIYSRGKKQDEALQELLSECPLPKNGQREMDPSEMETGLRNFVSTTARLLLLLFLLSAGSHFPFVSCLSFIYPCRLIVRCSLFLFSFFARSVLLAWTSLDLRCVRYWPKVVPFIVGRGGDKTFLALFFFQNTIIYSYI